MLNEILNQEIDELKDLIVELVDLMLDKQVEGAEIQAWIHGHRYTEDYMQRSHEAWGRAKELAAKRKNEIANL